MAMDVGAAHCRFSPGRAGLGDSSRVRQMDPFSQKSSGRLVVVDLSEKCIQACRRRFRDSSNIEYHTNDGKSLDMIPDRSIDFAFSFDSLVHAEADVIRAYLEQLGKKLKPHGVGFIHHSNLGEYRNYFSALEAFPQSLRSFLERARVVDKRHWRAMSMTARLFQRFARDAGLRCLSQEIVNWGTRRMIDCLSLFTPVNSKWARDGIVADNPNFMKEARHVSKLSRIYVVPSKRITGTSVPPERKIALRPDR
jgi:SAM-dependent methyltransferase